MEPRHHQLKCAALALGACAALLLPLFTAPFPPLGDYPNHLARIWILLHRDTSPFLTSLVELNRHITPNLGFEILAIPLGTVLPILIAGRITVGIILLIHLGACVLMARSVSPDRWQYGLVVGVLGIHGGIQHGYLSYSLAASLAILTLACWIRWDRGGGIRWGLLTTALAAPLALVHATGPVILMTAAGGIVGLDVLRRVSTFRRALHRVLPVLPTAIGFLLLRRPTVPGVGDSFAWNTLSGKIAALMTWSRTYYLTFDLLWVVAALGLLGLAIVRRPSLVDKDLLVASLALWLMLLVMPVAIMTGSGADARFGPPAAALLLLAVGGAVLSMGTPAVLLATGLVLTRQGVIAERWHAYSASTRDAVELLGTLPTDALLMQCWGEEAEGKDGAKQRMPFRHTGQYVTITSGGLANSIFGLPTQQPIIVDHRRLDSAAAAINGNCVTPTWPYLLTAAGGVSPIGYQQSGARGDWRLWQREVSQESNAPREPVPARHTGSKVPW